MLTLMCCRAGEVQFTQPLVSFPVHLNWHPQLITPSPSLQPALLEEVSMRFPLHGEPGSFSSHCKDPQLMRAWPPFPVGRNCIFHPNSLHWESCKMSKAILHSQLVALSFGHCCKTTMPCTAQRGVGCKRDWGHKFVQCFNLWMEICL